MGKEVAVGNTVNLLEEHYSCYNPYVYLEHIPYNKYGKDGKIIAKIKGVDVKLKSKLFTLYRDLLILRKGNVYIDIEDLLRILQEYRTLVFSLEEKYTYQAKVLFDDWKLEWMLKYIKDSDLLEDEEFMIKNHLTLTKEIKNMVNSMRQIYFTEDELLQIFGEDYFVECYSDPDIEDD